MNFSFNRLLTVILPLAVFAINYSSIAQDFDREMVRIAEQITTAADSAGIKSIATADFVDLHGDVSELGRFLAEELSTDLVLGKKKLSIIDRTNLKRILEEHKLTMSGLLEPENAKKLGQFAGVDALVIGTITPLEKSVRVSIKIITTDSAKIVGAARGDIAKSQSIEDLLGKIAVAPDSPGTTAGLPKIKQRNLDLGNKLSFSLETVRFTKEQLLAINGTLTNKAAAEVTVFAGYVENLIFPGAGQELQVSAVDESGDKFVYKSAEGFTNDNSNNKSRYTLYQGANQYVILAPNDSAPVTLYLEVSHGRYGPVPHLYDAPKAVDLMIAFRIMLDVRTRKLTDKTASFRNYVVQ